MAVYVDELIAWPQPPKPGAERFFGNGKESCHLLTDGSLDELHRFAEQLGLRRDWFQREIDPRLGHYDLTPALRALAVQMGAVEMPSLELILLMERVGPPPDA